MTDLLPRPGGGDERRRKENTRSRLLQASVPVFAEKGLEGATIDDLVRAAGFTRGAFYSNFSTKEELFGAAFSLATDEIIRIMTERMDSWRGFHGRIVSAHAAGSSEDTQMMLEVFEAVRPYGRQWFLLHSEAVSTSLRSPQARELVTEQRARLRTVIAGALRESLEAAEAAAGTRLELAISLEDLAQLVMSIFVDLMVREQLESIEVRDLATVTLLRTIRAFMLPLGP